MATQLMNFRASEELRQAIRNGARSEGVTSSEFLRQLVRARARAGIASETESH